MNTTPRIRSHSYETILSLSVEHPMLDAQDIAVLLGRPLYHVKAVMSSSAFLEERARRIMAKYGDQIVGIRGQVLSAASDAIEAIRRRIADPNSDVHPEQLLKAAAFLMQFIAAPVADPKAKDKPGEGVNITLNLSPAEFEQAKAIRHAHVRQISLPPGAVRSEPRATTPGIDARRELQIELTPPISSPSGDT